MNDKNNALQISLTTAVQKALDDGASTIPEIRDKIKERHNEVYPEAIIASCLKDDMIPFQEMVNLEQEDLQLIWKNFADNAYTSSESYPTAKIRNKS